MYPILGRYGPFFLYSFSVALAVGVLAGLAAAGWWGRRRTAVAWLDGGLAALATAVFGGRLGFVVGNWDYFQVHPGEVWQLWQGGLSFYGALAAGMAGLWLWCRWQERPFLLYAATLAPGVVLVGLAGWGACWLEGCAYGREATIGPLTADLPDHFGVYGLRYRTQLVGMTGMGLLLPLVWWGGRRWPTAVVVGVTLLGLALIQGGVSFLRGDSMPVWNGWRLDTLLSGMLALFSLILIQYGRINRTGRSR